MWGVVGGGGYVEGGGSSWVTPLPLDKLASACSKEAAAAAAKPVRRRPGVALL